MEGGSQAQDHGQAIVAKIGYSVSSTFVTQVVAYRYINTCTFMFFSLETKSFAWFSRSLMKVSKNKTNFAFLTTFTSYNKINYRTTRHNAKMFVSTVCILTLLRLQQRQHSDHHYKGCLSLDWLVTDVPFSKGLNCRMISVSVWNEQQFQL